MIEILEIVGDLTTRYYSDEGPYSDYDLAKDFIRDETEFAKYVINHEQAKEVRKVLTQLAVGLAQLIEKKSGES